MKDQLTNLWEFMQSQREIVKESYQDQEHPMGAFNIYVKTMNNILVDNMDELKEIIDKLPSKETEIELEGTGINSDLLDVMNSNLRKKHNLHVNVMIGCKEGFSLESEVWDYDNDLPFYWSYCIDDTTTGKFLRDGDNEQYYGSGYRSYEDALDAGIKHTVI